LVSPLATLLLVLSSCLLLLYPLGGSLRHPLLDHPAPQTRRNPDSRGHFELGPGLAEVEGHTDPLVGQGDYAQIDAHLQCKLHRSLQAAKRTDVLLENYILDTINQVILSGT